MKVKTAWSAVLIGTLALSSIAFAKDAGKKKEEERISNAGIVVHEILNVPDGIPRDLLDKARCVIVMPSVVKAAFVIGGSYGRGTMTCRTGEDFAGQWGAPAMYALEGASIGFQLGGEATDFVFLVMNDRGMNSLLHSKVKLGADASIAAGPIGRSAAADTDAYLRAEILSYSRARGVFAGVSLEGSTLRPDDDANRNLYGRRVSARDIVREREVLAPRAGAGFADRTAKCLSQPEVLRLIKVDSTEAVMGQANPIRALSASLRANVRIAGWLVLAFVGATFFSGPLNADVGVILNESMNTGMERIIGSGHMSIYFSGICPDSPIKLRLCRPGEEGSVMSTYINLGEDNAYEWNVVPFSIYINGVADPANRPLLGTQAIKNLLEHRYRDTFLSTICTTANCTTDDQSEWREMVGAGFSRSMYIFIARTSRAQDIDLIQKFNALPNENRFNGASHNCADFVKDLVNSYFPHSAHRDPINDFGITSPKAVARTFTKYARHHPELNFRVVHISQLPGTIKRSTEVRAGTEQLFRAKKISIPMALFAPYVLPLMAASYELTGRFNPNRQFETHAQVLPAQFYGPSYDSQFKNIGMRGASPQSPDASEKVVGTPQEWDAYRMEFASIFNEAVRDKIVPDRDVVAGIFARFQAAGIPYADHSGKLWIEVPCGGKKCNVGISASDILAPGSDPLLAFELLLARVQHELKASRHSRETLLELKQDWNVLERARERIVPSSMVAALLPQ